MLKILLLLLAITIAGCATNKQDFINHVRFYGAKNPTGFCAYSIKQTHTGSFPQYFDGTYACNASASEAQQQSLAKCLSSNRQQGCMVAFTYIASDNRLINHESQHEARIQAENLQKKKDGDNQRIEREQQEVERVAKRCDAFGFTRGTQSHSGCMVQIEIANKQQSQAQDATAAQQQLLQELGRQQALESFNNSLQNLNRIVNPQTPTITCNPSGIGGFRCR